MALHRWTILRWFFHSCPSHFPLRAGLSLSGVVTFFLQRADRAGLLRLHSPRLYEHLLDLASRVIQVFQDPLSVEVRSVVLIAGHLSPFVVQHIIPKDANFFMGSLLAGGGDYPICRCVVYASEKRSFRVSNSRSESFRVPSEEVQKPLYTQLQKRTSPPRENP
jgi:hypothetical protein